MKVYVYATQNPMEKRARFWCCCCYFFLPYHSVWNKVAAIQNGQIVSSFCFHFLQFAFFFFYIFMLVFVLFLFCVAEILCQFFSFSYFHFVIEPLASKWTELKIFNKRVEPKILCDEKKKKKGKEKANSTNATRQNYGRNGKWPGMKFILKGIGGFSEYMEE